MSLSSCVPSGCRGINIKMRKYANLNRKNNKTSTFKNTHHYQALPTHLLLASKAVAADDPPHLLALLDVRVALHHPVQC